MAQERQSNIELLRIIAMFMILVIHANMISLPKPTSIDLSTFPKATITRYLIESWGIVSVDCFVLISGWFLIKTRVKSILSFCFQIVFLWGGIFLFFLLEGKADLSLNNVLEIFAFTSWDWFIKAYIVLMIIAPILNSFLENSTEKTQRYVILGFFAFSSTYGWLGGANRFFVDGYGPLHFIGLYLLAWYVHHTSKESNTPNKKYFELDKKYDLLIFAGCIILNTFLGIISLHLGINRYHTIYAYTNPITIIASLYLLLFFSKIKIKTNSVINYLAKSSFAVYLIHSQVNIRPLFNKGVQYLYDNFDGFFCIISLFFFLTFVYLISVVLDYPRLLIWNRISNKFNLK